MVCLQSQFPTNVTDSVGSVSGNFALLESRDHRRVRDSNEDGRKEVPGSNHDELVGYKGAIYRRLESLAMSPR